MNGIRLCIALCLGTHFLCAQSVSECQEPIVCAKTRQDVYNIVAADPAVINRGIGDEALTPLHLAVFQRRPEVFLTLLELGANPNAVTARKVSVLKTIIDVKQAQQVQLLTALLQTEIDISWESLNYARIVAMTDSSSEELFNLLESAYIKQHPSEKIVYTPLFFEEDLLMALESPVTCTQKNIEKLIAYGAVVTDEVVSRAVNIENDAHKKNKKHGEIKQVVDLLLKLRYHRN